MALTEAMGESEAVDTQFTLTRSDQVFFCWVDYCRSRFNSQFSQLSQIPALEKELDTRMSRYMIFRRNNDIFLCWMNLSFSESLEILIFLFSCKKIAASWHCKFRGNFYFYWRIKHEPIYASNWRWDLWTVITWVVSTHSLRLWLWVSLRVKSEVALFVYTRYAVNLPNRYNC